MTEKSFEEKEVLEEKEMPVEEVEEEVEEVVEEVVEEEELEEEFEPVDEPKNFFAKRVSTLVGGLAIGGVTLVFLVIILIMWLAN